MPDQELHRLLLQRMDSQAEQLDRIEDQVRKTNGRVTDLEISRATERGAALQRAATIEDVRQVRATDIARNAWIRPGIIAVIAVALDAFLQHLK